MSTNVHLKIDVDSYDNLIPQNINLVHIYFVTTML